MIKVSDAGGLWTLTLHRPEKAGALPATLLPAVANARERATSARALIQTGRPRVPWAGAGPDKARAGPATCPARETGSSRFPAFPGLANAALNGTLPRAGAMGMAPAPGLRFAMPGAAVLRPAMRPGLLPQPSGPVRLAALAGSACTRRILTAGTRKTVPEALARGLIP